MAPELSARFRLFRAVFLITIGSWFFLIPGCQISLDLWSSSVRSGDIPSFVFRSHRNLAPKFERWIEKRLDSGRASLGLSELGVAGTEWPLFSAVFFLWTTEALQSDWDRDPTNKGKPPMQWSSAAVEAAADLLADTEHATWVRQYWGDDYLQRENLFYRMLLITGFRSYQALTGSDRFESMLREQATGLMRELDQSPHGLLDDYPGQCYPIDIVPALAGIGTAATTFGLGAARTQGRIDHAWPLTAQAMVASWPLPNGSMLIPRFLAVKDAPFVGEAALLFSLSRPFGQNVSVTDSFRVPPNIFVALGVYFGLGGFLVFHGFRLLHPLKANAAPR